MRNNPTKFEQLRLDLSPPLNNNGITLLLYLHFIHNSDLISILLDNCFNNVVGILSQKDSSSIRK